jgi:hypothetical protein
VFLDLFFQLFNMLLWPDPTLGKTIWSIVPPADSDARKDGKDIMFTLCSEECGDQLKETLEIEKDLGELILSAEHIY